MDNIFIIKKLVVILTAPLSISLLIGLTGLVLLYFGRQKVAGVVLSGSLLITWASAFNPIANSLLGLIETTYPPFEVSAFKPQKNDTVSPMTYIHVLGGGHSEGERYSDGSQLSSSSLARVVEGIRIFNIHKAQQQPVRLVFSGYEGFSGVNKMPNAMISRSLALNLTVPEEDILTFPDARDTRDEALALARITGRQAVKVILVSSASHLPRAVMIFEQEGINVTPAPTYILSSETTSSYHPTYEALQKTERFLYEKIGQLWVWLKGPA